MKKIMMLAATMAAMQCTFAQVNDSTKKVIPPVNITGSVDVYYRYDFNNPKTAPYNNLTSFVKSSNSFELGMASIRADHSFGKVSATIDIGFGKRAEEFAYNDANTRLVIKQLLVIYAPSPTVKFTLGTWGTHIGYEVVDAYLNRNYSMSNMFTNGPFTHTGFKTDISLGGKNTLMVGISNPIDFRTAPAAPKTFIAQFGTGTKDDKLKVFFNFAGGKQNDFKKVIQGDIVATYAASSKFSIAVNGTLQSVKADLDSNGTFNKSTWGGAALYFNYDAAKWVGITLRTEYISDKDNYLGIKNSFAPTLSANFKIDNLTIIPEIRFDKTGNSLFYKNAAETSKSTGSFLIAAVYHF